MVCELIPLFTNAILFIRQKSINTNEQKNITNILDPLSLGWALYITHLRLTTNLRFVLSSFFLPLQLRKMRLEVK